ncbi:MAG: tRNA (N6-isopentenyl adenosine(37)-C2)-methylthiotransferase MiaB [bacterium]
MVNFFFKTYGCQANVADSQGLAQYLISLGCSAVYTEQEADLIIINTCAVREKAEQKLGSYLGELAPLKLEKPYIAIGIIGCVASYKKKELFERFDHIKFIHGAKEDIAHLRAYLHDLIVQIQTAKQFNNPAVILEMRKQDRTWQQNVQPNTLLTMHENNDEISLGSAQEVKRSFINIMTGCNKYCSYCIVPFTRGREISYPMEQILDRVRHDVALGSKEITLVGQNVNSYIDPDTGVQFPDLLERVAQISGDFWVRFVSPHPQDMTEKLFDVMASHRPKLTAYVHFPIQSGSNTILKAMNRNYTIEEFHTKIGWLRDRMPDAFISTDIIIGFPGETDTDFGQTMDALEKIRFNLAYSFIYSRRQFTKAFNMPDNCSASVKLQRLTTLQERQIEIALERNIENIGKNFTCLVEKRLEHGKLLARTEGSLRVHLEGSDDAIGKFVTVTILTATPTHLCGRAA